MTVCTTCEHHHRHINSYDDAEYGWSYEVIHCCKKHPVFRTYRRDPVTGRKVDDKNGPLKEFSRYDACHKHNDGACPDYQQKPWRKYLHL
jgi:hypothetical protein